MLLTIIQNNFIFNNYYEIKKNTQTNNSIKIQLNINNEFQDTIFKYIQHKFQI